MTLKNVLFAFFVLVVMGLNVLMTYNALTSQFAAQNDFLSRWEGARTFFVDGESPYSDTATRNIQTMIYGRSAVTGEDEGLFVYPFYTAILIAPLVFLPYAWAAAFIIVLLEASLIAGLLALFGLFSWRMRPLMLGAWVLWALFGYFGARGILLGQLGLVVYAFQMLALWALYKNRDVLAGVLLSLVTIKPQMSILLVPFLLLWAWRVGRYRFVTAFLGAWGVLMGASFILSPSWFGDWIVQVQRYPSYTRDGSPVWVLIQHYLGLGDVVEGGINALLLGLLAWAWYGVLVQRREETFLWTVTLTLILTHTIVLKTATPHFVVFTLPLVFYGREWARKGRDWAFMGVLFVVMIAIWAHFFFTIEGNLEHLSLFLPAPFVMLGLVWLTRVQWWERAPRFSFGAKGETS